MKKITSVIEDADIAMCEIDRPLRSFSDRVPMFHVSSADDGNVGGGLALPLETMRTTYVATSISPRYFTSSMLNA